MTKRMLIDATHSEETRVAIADNDFLVEFDYESKLRKQLKGSIFLAKVTRVEPSLQAAFVNFGGNRHGFLPFSEIHPDYFRIPVADREALIEAQKAELEARDRALAEDEDEEDLAEAEIIDGDVEEIDDGVDDEEDVVEVGGADKPAEDDEDEDNEEDDNEEDESEEELEETALEEDHDDDDDDVDGNVVEDDDDANGNVAEEDAEDDDNKGNSRRRSRGGRNRGRGRRGRSSAARSKRSEKYGDEADDDAGRPFRFDLRRNYKIQEVIKRGQIVLVQASKEERGNKGAAVTTYLSLPGRYCVLMPNSPRGGGVSRKIGSYQERKRLKKVLADLEIPDGMSVILRTAGVGRTKAEIKRDLDYLLRLWNTIREDTLASNAPALIYEEGNLIKRSIRDLYDKDIEEVLVAGDEGLKNAKAFMKMLMPSHVKKVKEYKDDKIPLFHRYHIESQISDIGKTNVTLKSGGYLVINPTEALVSVDVNSGRATKERHIEETALKTNMEAAEEVARQMRLRDLGGLVVIDFIDMEERRNNRKVENKLRQALSQDRARIQVGRISSFGLLELSRQRLNPSLTEMQFEPCPECGGLGRVPTLDFAAVKVMRALEEEGIKGNASELSLTVPQKISFYLLNQKREMMSELEARYDFKVFVRADDEMAISECHIEVQKKRGKNDNNSTADEEDAADQSENADPKTHKSDDTEGQKKSSRGGRRRGRRGGRNRRNRQKTEGADNNTQENSSGSVENEDEDNTNKPARKRSARKSSNKPAEESTVSKDKKDKDIKAEKAPVPSNDTKPKDEAPAAKDYETVNEPPKQKKKGWWSKVTGD